MTQPNPVTMAIHVDSEDIALRDIPAALASRDHELAILSQENAKLEREIERLTALQPDYLKACLDEGIAENARLLKLAVWAAKESGEHCPDCEDKALGEYYLSGDCVGKPDSDEARSAIEEDLLEWASGTCTRGDCVGGWIAYVPDGEPVSQLKRGES